MALSQGVLERATKIASECQGQYDAYCRSRCPMRTDAIGYVNLIGEGKTEDALLKIREKLFLPGTLGRICAHPCESVCRRGTEYGESISIAALKRYAADKADREELWDTTKRPATGKSVAVIGAGPAGAQAAIDLAKEGHDVTIYEKLDVVGGMMRVGIPAYRLPRDLIDFEYSYLNKLGVTFKMGTEIGRDVPFSKLTEAYDAVVLANGAHRGFVPPMEGAKDITGITNAVDFLKSTSLTPESVKPGSKVVVIGGGDVAMDCARSSLRVGATDVTLVSLEEEVALPASHHEQVGAREEGINFQCGWGGSEVLSTDGKITGLKIKKVASIFDQDGNFNPSYTEEELEIACDTLIFAAGQVVADVTEGLLKQGRAGRYVTDKETLATSLDNVFVAGDNAGGVIVVEAMALGRKAALSVNNFLAGKGLKEGRNFDMEQAVESKLNLPLPTNVENLSRKHTQTMDPKERIKTFDECDFGYDDETAQAEGHRCLKCECKKCMTECIMLNEHGAYPGEIFKKTLANGDVDTVMAYSCNMCDQCTIVCPEEYKFAELFGMVRKDKVKANGGESPMPGHKAINMHQKLGFSKLFTIKTKGVKK